MDTMTTDSSTSLLAAALAGKITLSEDYDDLFADFDRRQAEKGYTAVLRREHAAIYARGVTPAGALTALHRVVLDNVPSAESIDAILQMVGRPKVQLELRDGLL
jgi:hypothetical protein